MHCLKTAVSYGAYFSFMMFENSNGPRRGSVCVPHSRKKVDFSASPNPPPGCQAAIFCLFLSHATLNPGYHFW